MRRDSAPPDLEPLQSFCNTAVHLYGHDALAQPEQAAEWLSDHDFPALGDQSDLQALIEARETIRTFITQRTDAEAIRHLNRLIASASASPAVGTDGTLTLHARSNEPATSVICSLLQTLLKAGLSNDGTRLKACAAPDCRWVFYDRSPAANGLWCDMSICGARHKMRTYRARVDTAGPPGEPGRQGRRR